MLEKKRVLILDNDLIHYRIPIYNILGKKYDLTHACCYPQKIEDEINFKRVTLDPFKFGPFVLQKNGLNKLCNKFDAVICYCDLHYLQYILLPLNPNRKYKIGLWGIGVSASYNNHYDSNNKWTFVRNFFERKADSLIFYTDYPIQKHLAKGFKRESMFVAPNTVAVEDVDLSVERSNFLFIGTLYKEKGIFVLLDAYRMALQEYPSLPALDIIGKGPEYENVKKWLKDEGLDEKVILHGAIYDRKIKADFFHKALACLSPMQAGLTVLESQGYGTPFITTKNAITGGEIFNIDNGRTGVLLENAREMKNAILDVAQNPSKYKKIGDNARKYYLDCRKPSNMAQGFIDAVEYMLNKKD